jgi:RHS repeat-associated protein
VIVCFCNLAALADPPMQEYSKLGGPPRAWQVGVPATPYSVVNMAHGNVFTAIPLLVRTPMALVAYHNSMAVVSETMVPAASGMTAGRGWSLSYTGSVVRVDPDTVKVLEDDGSVNTFTRVEEVWIPPKGVHDRLTEEVNSHWLLTRKNGAYRRFDYEHGRLLAIGDPNGHETLVLYDSLDRLSIVVDAWGRMLGFLYDGESQAIDQITYWADPDLFTFRFWIDEGYLYRIDFGGDPSPPYWGFGYTDEGRIETFRDRDGRVWTIEGKTYEFNVIDPPPTSGDPLSRRFNTWKSPVETTVGRHHTLTDRRGQVWEYDFTEPFEVGHRALVRSLDPLGFGPYLQYDDNLNVLHVTDALGSEAGDPDHTTHFTWDEHGNLTSVTNPLGATTAFTYGDVDNLTEVFLPADYNGGTLATASVELKYDDPGHPRLPTEVREPATEPNGPPSSVGLEWNGPAQTYGCDGSPCSANNANGRLARFVDANGVTHDYGYDCNGLLCSEVEARDSDSPRAVWVWRDPAGRVRRAGRGLIPGEGETYACPYMDLNGGCLKARCEVGPPAVTVGGPGTCGTITIAQPTQGCVELDYSNEGLVLAEYQTCLYDTTGEDFWREHWYHRNELGLVNLDRFRTDREPWLYQEWPWPGSYRRWVYYEHDLAAGTFRRKKPWPSTEDDLVVQLDVRGLPQTVTRNGVTATYAYDPGGAVHSVTYSGGPRTVFSYDKARRLIDISHQRDCSGTWTEFLGFHYTHRPDGLIIAIDERHRDDPCGTGSTQTCTVSFDYDARGRLVHENRSDLGTLPGYDLTYVYDAGGNRLKKLLRNAAQTQTIEYVEYTYDVHDPNAPSRANRLLRYDVFEAPNGPLLRDVRYEYDADGNVSRIIRHEAGSPEERVTSLIYRDHTLLWITVEEVWTMGETQSTCERTKIREFRYDGSGQLYMTQTLSTQPAEDPSLIPTGDAVWTEFDGVSPLRDIRMGINRNTTPPTPDIEELRLHQLGSWQHDAAAGQTQFYQADHLGTTRRMTTGSGQTVQYAAYTAFGEPVASLTQPTPPISRYGYVGALGYEAPVDGGFPYLHLGYRWYDPETGRFLQRDPIGVAGGLNTYAYVASNPVQFTDPAGLVTLGWSLGVGALIPFLAGSAEVGLHYGWSSTGQFSVDILISVGGGAGLGAGASGALLHTWTNAESVDQLTGPGWQVDASGGPLYGCVMGGTGYRGAQVGVGPGIGGGITGQRTRTASVTQAVADAHMTITGWIAMHVINWWRE